MSDEAMPLLPRRSRASSLQEKILAGLSAARPGRHLPVRLPSRHLVLQPLLRRREHLPLALRRAADEEAAGDDLRRVPATSTRCCPSTRT